MSEIFIKNLSCGLRLVHERRKGSDICAVSLRLPAGSLYDEKPGTAHLLEHVVLSGTKTYASKNDLEYALEQWGGRGGGRTSYEHALYWASVPTHALQHALHYVAETVYAPLLREEDFVREQKIVFQEAKRRDSHTIEIARQRIDEVLFAGTPFAKTVIGTPQDVQALTCDDLVAFWEKYYRGVGGVISIVSSHTHEDVTQLIENVCADFVTKPFSISRVSIPHTTLDTTTLCTIDDQQADQNRLLVVYQAPNRTDGEKSATDVLATIVGGGKTSRLFRAVRAEKGLTYDISASAVAGAGYGRFVVITGATSEYIDEITTIIGAEIQRICKEGVADTELMSGKERNIFNTARLNEGADDRADTLSWAGLFFEKPEQWLDARERYAHVTKDDVQHVAQKIFSQPPVVALIKKQGDQTIVVLDTLRFQEIKPR